MIISKTKLNESYLKYCTLHQADPLDETVTKDFMEQWMKRKNFTHVKQTEDSFHFLKAHKQ